MAIIANDGTFNRHRLVTEIETLKALVCDLEHLLNGEDPHQSDLADAPMIDNWDLIVGMPHASSVHLLLIRVWDVSCQTALPPNSGTSTRKENMRAHSAASTGLEKLSGIVTVIVEAGPEGLRSEPR